MGNRPIRVAIIDDHEVVRRGLALFLDINEEFLLVGEADSARTAVRICAEARPDVVLLDLLLGTDDAVPLIGELRRTYPAIRIIAVTGLRDATLVRRTLQAGASGFLFKNVSAGELADAIRAVHASRPALAPEATQALIDFAARQGTMISDLSTREREILRLLVQGLANPAIAERLAISKSTAKAHVSNILAKLGVTTRAEAAAAAVANRLLD